MASFFHHISMPLQPWQRDYSINIVDDNKITSESDYSIKKESSSHIISQNHHQSKNEKSRDTTKLSIILPDKKINERKNFKEIKMWDSTNHYEISSLSKEYGDAIISRDLDKEEEFFKPRPRNESVSEDTNLNDARALWGVKLRHVRLRESQSQSITSPVKDSFVFGFPKLRRLSGYEKNDSKPQRNGYLKYSDRSHSVDFLNSDSVFNGDIMEENSVRQRVSAYEPRNFSSTSSTSPERKYSGSKNRRPSISPERKYSENKSPIQRKISNQMFYQPTRAEVNKPVLNLEELLKHDEQKLKLDVYEEADLEKSIIDSKSLKSQTKSKTEPVVTKINKYKKGNDQYTSTSNEKIEILKSNNNKKPNNAPVKSMKIIDKNFDENNIKNDINSIKTPIKNDSKTVQGNIQNNKNNGASPLQIKESRRENIQENTIKIDNNVSKPIEINKENVQIKNQQNMLAKSLSIGKEKVIKKIVAKTTSNTNAPPKNSSNSQRRNKTASQGIQPETKIVAKLNKKSSKPQSPKKEYFFNMNKKSVELKEEELVQPEINTGVKYNKLGQIILDDYALPKEPIKQTLDNKEEKSNFSKDKNDKIPILDNDNISKLSPLTNNNNNLNAKNLSTNKPTQVEDNNILPEKNSKIFETIKTVDPVDSIFHNKNDNSAVIFTEQNSSPSLKIIDSKITKAKTKIIETEPELPYKKNAEKPMLDDQKKNLPKIELAVTSSTPSVAKNQNTESCRIGKLTIIPGVDRDIQLEYGKYKPGSKMKPENISKFKNGFKVLTFTSNEIYEVDLNEPEAIVPEVIYNGPIEKTVSIMKTTRRNPRKQRKKTVTFATKKLVVVHSYPSEASYIPDETDSSAESAESSNFSSYQPVTTNPDLGISIERERERIQFSSYVPYEDENVEQEALPTTQVITEGDHFNSYSNQEGGHAMLF